MAMISCHPNEPTVTLSQKIIGKWKRVTKDGVATLTENREILTFLNDKSATFSMAAYKTNEKRWIWEKQTTMEYTIENNRLCIKKDAYIYSTIDRVSENLMEWTVDSVVVNGVDVKDDIKATFAKVTVDYTQDILGLWEGVEMTGDETYDVEERIEYRADGSYVYYKKDGDSWTPSSDVNNEYNMDGDWLVLRWRNATEEDFHYEWWDVEYVQANEMKWTSLREKEDGTRFTSTFTWKRVK